MAKNAPKRRAAVHDLPTVPPGEGRGAGAGRADNPALEPESSASAVIEFLVEERDRWNPGRELAARAQVIDALNRRNGRVMIRLTPMTAPIVAAKIEA